MKFCKPNSSVVTRRWARALGATLTMVLMVTAGAFSQYANPEPVPLLTAGTYGVLAYSGITGSANVNGDVGTSTATIDGTIVASGTNWGVGGTHNADAQTDLAAALTNANGRTNDETVAADALGGKTFGHGVYAGGALDLATGTTLTLNGSATDIFIIKASSTLKINTNGTVALTGGAVWSNVFWYVGTSATILSGSTFNGIILANVSITLNTGATLVSARLLANTGAVTVNSDLLPVELIAFTATAGRTSAGGGFHADLRWSTASEVNNYGFEIERRESAMWEKIGFVAGAGSSSSPRDYSYIDGNVSTGRYAYRLKQIDNAGTFVYHGSAEIEIGSSPQAFGLLQNYPNPFNPSTAVSYQVPVPSAANGSAISTVSLKVYDVMGREVAILVDEEQPAGTHTVIWDAANYTSGAYFCHLRVGNNLMTRKMFLLR